MGIDQRGPARQLGELAHEGARAVGSNWNTGSRVLMLRNIHLPGQNDRETVARITDTDESLARTVRPDLAEPAESLDHRRFQDREHRIPSRVYDRHTRLHG